METADLILAIFHHLVVFSVFAVLAVETVLLKPGIGRDAIARLANADRIYGTLSGLIIVIGIARVYFGLKGWEFYVYSWTFWAKMIAFGIVGLLSVPPTMRFIRWNNAAKADPAYVVPAGEVAAMHVYLRGEGAFFLLILVFAAAMARGYGS